MARDVVEAKIGEWIAGARDMGAGYVWLKLCGLDFGEQPATLALCFYQGCLDQASWSVQLPNAPIEDGWPTREAIDAEVAFVKKVLARDMNLAVPVRAASCARPADPGTQSAPLDLAPPGPGQPAVGHHPGRWRHQRHRPRRLGDRSGSVPLGPGVLCLTGLGPASELVRRQGQAGTHLEDG